MFQILLKNGIPFFAIYLISGLLVWNLFSSALPAATGAIVGNAAIVKKVAFPARSWPWPPSAPRWCTSSSSSSCWSVP